MSSSKLHEELTGRITGLNTAVHAYHLIAREAEGRKIEGLKASLSYIQQDFSWGQGEDEKS